MSAAKTSRNTAAPSKLNTFQTPQNYNRKTQLPITTANAPETP